MAHHKRKRPIGQRAGCWCKYGKKIGSRELRGPQSTGLHSSGKGIGARVRLAERAREAEDAA